MKVLFDAVHPAHVHFYKNLAQEIVFAGGEVLFVGRERDVISGLLESLPYRHISFGRPKRHRFGQAFELVIRTLRLIWEARRFEATHLCARNPAGIVAAWFLPGVTSFFDTDDGPAAGPIYSISARFADVITAPQSVGELIDSPRLHTYKGFKASAYLHPKRFTADRSLVAQLDPHDRGYAILRFVSMKAVHDVGEAGISLKDKERLVTQLSKSIRVFVSAEDSSESPGTRLNLGAGTFLDALGQARLYVGDSQSVAAEACLLGTPAIHCNTWSGRLPALQPLVDLGLLESFRPGGQIDIVDSATNASERAWTQEMRSNAINAVSDISEDVTAWYFRLLQAATD